MANVIALTQFVFLALGSAGVIALSRVQGYATDTIHDVRLFVASHALWLLAIPLLWWVFAQVTLNLGKGEFSVRFVQATGVLLSAAILAFYGWLIF
jgi:uncharacterized membrane protein YgdD (TMEM256/DUF423 family)